VLGDILLVQRTTAVYGAERKLMVEMGCFRFCPIRAAGTTKLVVVARDLAIVARSASILAQEPPAERGVSAATGA
jgi:hypothetical protein